MKLPFALIVALTTATFAAIQPPPLADAAPASKPGLTLTFTTPDGKTDTRTARLLALFVPADQSPTPFLPAGNFTAKWEGEIVSALRAEYLFSAASSGGFKFSINGVPVTDGARVKLNKGAINLALSHERMRHDDYLRWVLHPQRIDPESKMSRFADDDGKTPLTDFFAGKASAQFEAIWHFLQSLKK